MTLGDEFLERAKARGSALARFPLSSAWPMRDAYVEGWLDHARNLAAPTKNEQTPTDRSE